MADSNTRLPDVPIPPPELLEASGDRKLVLFVGAGVSRLCGSPGWDGFAHALLSRLTQKGLIDHSLRTQLATLPLKTRISIALSIAGKHEQDFDTGDYRDILMTNNDVERAIGHDVYRNLSSISSRVVTTNFDEWLEFTYPEAELTPDRASLSTPQGERTLACIPSDLSITSMDAGTVIHLHGSMRSPKSMILTTAGYLVHYRNDRASGRNPVTAFLHNLLQKGGWTVLFIGYGMEEMEVLEYVLQKSMVFEESSDDALLLPCRHYLLKGFYSHEMPLVEHLQNYFRENCGVKLIPFSLDVGDHSQLQVVIGDWAKRIRGAAPLPSLEKRIEFEKLLEN